MKLGTQSVIARLHMKKGHTLLGTQLSDIQLANGSGVVSAQADTLSTQATSLIDQGGPVLTNVQVQLIFWGSAWSQPSQNPSVDEICDATRTILEGPYLQGLEQYRTIGSGMLRGSTVVTSTVRSTPADPPQPFSNDEITELLANLVTVGAVPDPTSSSQLLYCIILPGGARTDGSFIGEHSYFRLDGQKVHYAWATNDGTLDYVTNILSHELAEAVTDPEGTAFRGKTDDQQRWQEIGDPCVGETARLDTVSMQKYWSERDQTCVMPVRLTVPSQSLITALARSPEHLDFFVEGFDGGAYSEWWCTYENNHRWSACYRIGDSSATFPEGSTLTPLARTSSRLNLFTVGNDGGVYNAWWDLSTNNARWNPWSRIGTEAEFFPPQSVVTAVARTSEQIDIFVVGYDGGVYTTGCNCLIDDAQWHTWTRVGESAFPERTTVAAVARTSECLDIFAVGYDGGVYSAEWNLGAQYSYWGSWFRIGNEVDSFPQRTPVAAIARSSQTIDIFAVGSNGGLYSTRKEDDTAPWSRWFRIGDEQDVFPQQAPISAVARTFEHLDIFVIGTNGGVYSAWWNSHANHAYWNSWFRVGNEEAAFPLRSNVAAVARRPDRLDLFTIGKNGGVYSAWWDLAENSIAWSSWARL